MGRALLVRHGMCDPVGKSIAGWLDGVALNAHGQQQVSALAHRLASAPIAAVYTSPLLRARETADPIARSHGIEPIERDAFGELRFGTWTGRTLAQLEHDSSWLAFNTVRSLIRAPEGELMLETQARAVAELLRLRDQHTGETIVVVSHADVIRAILCHLLGMSLDHLSRLRIDPASVTDILFHGAVPELVSLNATAE